MDNATSGRANKVWICRMRSIGTDGNVREGRFLMLQNGADKRLLRFLSPADMRNTAMLALGKGELYVYLPADRRVRRLGTSALNQTFLGSDFNAEDLGSVRLQGRVRRAHRLKQRQRDAARADSRSTSRSGRASSPSSSTTTSCPRSSSTITPGKLSRTWNAHVRALRSRATRRGCRHAC